MHKVRGNYSSFTGRSSENICSRTSEGAQETGGQKQDETQFITPKNGAFMSFIPRLKKANALFLQVFFSISSGFGPNSGFKCCVFLTLWKTLLLRLLFHPIVKSWIPIGHFSWVSCTPLFCGRNGGYHDFLHFLRESYFYKTLFKWVCGFWDLFWQHPVALNICHLASLLERVLCHSSKRCGLLGSFATPI